MMKPPHHDEDLFGEPVIEYGTSNEYWEVYTSSSSNNLFIAYYISEGGEWIKKGLDRRHITSLFDHDNWPVD